MPDFIIARCIFSASFAAIGYSKKFEYLIHSINLMVFHYNFVWKHSAHGQTPAMAASLANHPFTFSELLLSDEDL
jgi:hypothetical protein